MPKMTESDLASYPAVQAYWRKWAVEVTLPEAEMRQMFMATPEGKIGRSRTPGSLSRAILAGVEKPDFASIKAPVLSIVAMRTVADCLRSIQSEDDAARAACAEATGLVPDSPGGSRQGLSENRAASPRHGVVGGEPLHLHLQ
jgi:hypothetical protein